MKLVGRHAIPISSDTGLYDLRDALGNDMLFEKQKVPCRGCLQSESFLEAYLTHLRSFVDSEQLSRKRIVINANSGLAGQVAERLLAGTPIQICDRLFTEPDGTFSQIPAERPDPLRPENRELTTKVVRQTGTVYQLDFSQIPTLLLLNTAAGDSISENQIPNRC